ncbi:MAG TPA: LON peptidase substrate-binding domain-containing protein [Spirochaetia bacterium]|nr:LON peptidase substrate-binding domain-containing protein [Spirochaetia bacterium]
MEHESNRIPLFPLPAVLMPGTPLPLHIFEERYRLLLRRCIDSGSEFGVVYQTDSEISRVGCSAQIIDVTGTYDDGRSDIMTHGKRRFRIVQVHDELPYLEGSVEYFDDEPKSDDVSGLVTAGIALMVRVSRLAQVKLDADFLRLISPEEISFVLAGTCTSSPAERQDLIEMRSTRERLERSLNCLERSARQMSFQKSLETANGGKFDPSNYRN